MTGQQRALMDAREWWRSEGFRGPGSGRDSVDGHSGVAVAGAVAIARAVARVIVQYCLSVRVARGVVQPVRCAQGPPGLTIPSSALARGALGSTSRLKPLKPLRRWPVVVVVPRPRVTAQRIFSVSLRLLVILLANTVEGIASLASSRLL